jgi:hypothetical protein
MTSKEYEDKRISDIYERLRLLRRNTHLGNTIEEETYFDVDIYFVYNNHPQTKES